MYLRKGHGPVEKIANIVREVAEHITYRHFRGRRVAPFHCIDDLEMHIDVSVQHRGL